MTLRERMARAMIAERDRICGNLLYGGAALTIPRSAIPTELLDMYLAEADACLRAMRDGPELDLYRSAAQLMSDDKYIGIGRARCVWAQIIDAALSEGQPTPKGGD